MHITPSDPIPVICDPPAGAHTITWDPPSTKSPNPTPVTVYGGVNIQVEWPNPPGDTFSHPAAGGPTSFKKLGAGPQPILIFFSDGTGVELPSGESFCWT